MNLLHLSTSFKAFLRLLNDKQVEYLLVGGYAVRYYGYPRATTDLDLWTATHPLNAVKIVEACQAFGSGIPGLTPEPLRHENRIIVIEVPPLSAEILNPIRGRKPEVLHHFQGSQTERIEILTVQSGVGFETCFAERVVDTLDGVEVNIISLRHLQAIKRAGDRPKDLDDLMHLPQDADKTQPHQA